MELSLVTKILERIVPEFGARVEVEPAWGYAGRVVFPDGRTMRFVGTHLDVNSLGAAAMATDKSYALWALAQAGLPVPEGAAFFSRAWARAIGSDRTPDAALAYAEHLGFPVFVKPNSGRSGTDVHCVGDAATFTAVVRRIIRHDRVFRVERPVGASGAQRSCRHCESAKQSHTSQKIEAGEIASRTRNDDELRTRDLRIVVVGDTVVCAYERTPLAVVGDGHATIVDLIRAKRSVATMVDGRSINVHQRDSRVLTRLARIGRTLEDVPAVGERVQLLDNANLSSGGDARDITDTLDPVLTTLALRAAHVVGLAFAGVDIMVSSRASPRVERSRSTHEISPLRSQTSSCRDDDRSVTILELNAAPSLAHYAACGSQHRVRAEECYRRVLAFFARRHELPRNDRVLTLTVPRGMVGV